ncbi:ATP-dependent nuclease [Chryseobacterium sp. 3008163]|uniref:ATP-dependent nuclease n=1 Tax=Chryseobacterium sp. 3008163 TaxID=2478663 RepID=UPI000F0CD3B2|nr:AAA family ATPase [Chryseobacterium sp. 3008163]AYN00107.1 ATP-binding protein [Chryseobacterium sp. 3008163]
MSIQRDFNAIATSGHLDEFQGHTIAKEFKSPKFIYLPTLRTAHSLYKQIDQKTDSSGNISEYIYNKIEDDIFVDTVRKNYELYEDIDIFTGVHLYNEILDARNSKKEKRSRFETFEKFISQYFFDGKAIEIIAEFNKGANKKGDNTSEIISIHIEGEKHSRNLYHLGDGVQALILLMYKIFMADNDSHIFIDEPEINLHPGMQRLFLEQITSNQYLIDKNITYFISTHSNHFLDLTLEEENISIYSFYADLDEEGEKKLIIKNVNAGDNEVLKSIGVNNSSVFMANCSIWVEGISDRLYIRAFLKSYCFFIGENYPKEDIDFAFLNMQVAIWIIIF